MKNTYGTSSLPLCLLALTSQQAVPTVKEILKDILKNIPKSKRFKNLDWETTERKRIRVTRQRTGNRRLKRPDKQGIGKLLKGNK